MYMAFGDIFDRTEKFEPVPVAIVKEQDNMTLTAMLNAVSAEGEKNFLLRLIQEKRKQKTVRRRSGKRHHLYEKQAFSHGERKRHG